MKNSKLISIFTFLIILVSMSTLQSAKRTSNSNQYRIYDCRWVMENDMNMPLTNYSQFGQTVSGEAGFYWPSGFPNETYIYGAGLWVGGRIRNDTNPSQFDTFVTCGYDPSGGGVEFTAGLMPNDDPGNPNEKVYFSSDSDWPLDNASGGDSIVSMLDTYCTFNDYDSSRHFVPENLPLNISVIQQTYSFRGEFYNDIIFFVYNVVLDPSVDTVHNAFLSVVADNDIGNEALAAANDLCGFDIGRNMGFQWQNDPESGWAHFPGTIAFKFLQGPKSNGVDTVHYYNNGLDSIVIGPNDTLGITAFKIISMIGNAGDPDDKYERYQVISGYNYWNLDTLNPENSYNPFDIDNYGPHDKRFVESSGPFNLIPGDTAKLIFAIIMAEDTSELPVKADVVQSMFDGGWVIPMPPAVPDLFGVPGTNKVTLYWENNPEITPDKYSNITSKDSIQQNGQTVPNPFYNPAYRGYDFEGYKVWKSIYTDPSTFQMIAHFDKDDGLQVLRQDSLYDISGDTFVIIKAETLGFDNGLAYTLVDTNIPYSNITYYYAVTAYDANYFGYMVDSVGNTIGIDPLSYKSLITDNMIPVVPDSQQNFITEPYSTITFENGNPLLPYANVVYPDGVPIVNDILDDSTVYHIRFGPITKSIEGTPIYTFYADTISGDRYLPQDTLGNPILLEIKTEAIDSGPTFVWKSINPVSFPLYGAVIYVDSISVYPANNIVDSIILNDLGTPYNTENLILVDSVYASYPKINSHPCYNGGSYRITWHPVYIDSLSDSALTCDVYDIVNETEIPYSGLWEMNWRFGKVSNEINQGQYALVSSFTADNWKWMYIAGTMILFNYHPEMPIPPQRVQPMVQANKPVEGEEWYIYTTGCPTPSSGNSFNITFTKGTLGIYDQLEHSKLDNVTVAPNPYLISSSKNINGKRKGLMFKGLPKKCDISIYSLNGSLIDMIEHRSSTDDVIEYWNVNNNLKLKPVSGVYFYMVETIDRRYHKSGKIVLIR